MNHLRTQKSEVKLEKVDVLLQNILQDLSKVQLGLEAISTSDDALFKLDKVFEHLHHSKDILERGYHELSKTKKKTT